MEIFRIDQVERVRINKRIINLQVEQLVQADDCDNHALTCRVGKVRVIVLLSTFNIWRENAIRKSH